MCINIYYGIMKREHGGGDDDRYGGRHKRQRADGFSEALAQGKFELRLLVSSKAAGAVIGKGGENIKRIRSQFDGHISVPDSNTPERVITMTSSIENVLKMVEDVLPRLDDGSNERDKAEIRVLVHQSHAGALIGRQGARIKELREKTNTRIKVFQDTAPQSSDRIVVIGGDESAILDAVRRIIEDLRNIPIKGPANPYSSFNYDHINFSKYGGYAPIGFTPAPPGRGPPAGRGPSGMNRGGYNNGPPPQMGGNRGYGPGPGMGNMGGMMGMGGPPPMPVPPPQQSSYMNLMQVKTNGPPSMYGGQRQGPPMSGYGGPPQMNGYGGPPAPQGIQTTQVTIPSDLGGTIIGRNGERINKIRDDSGANITLEKSTGAAERIITISGTAEQIHTAQYLLQQCVRSSAQGRKYYDGSR
ncbi:unnamed protein product [Auanema sp. JU1783]|nr:unnamed protein product [Auanema sp. JU1783]